MAITTFGNLFWPMPYAAAGVAVNFTATGTMNASGDRVGFIVQCPKAGTLDKFEVRTGTVGNNPDNGIRYSFQDLDASGNPDTVVDQFRDITSAISTGTWQTPGLITSDGTDTGTKRTVTQGQWIACVMDFVSFVASDSLSYATLRSDTISIGGISYVADGSAGSYTKGSTSYFPILALKYDDGTYANFGPDQVWPVQTINTYTYSSGTVAADERGMKFSLPVPVRVKGAWFHIDMDNDWEVVLYDSGSSVLESLSIDKDYRQGTGALVNPYYVYFDTAVSLSASTDYRIIAKPGASTISLYGLQAPGSAYMSAMPQSTYGVATRRVDAGAWTDATDEQILCGLILDGFDNGAGGGGGSGGSFTFVG